MTALNGNGHTDVEDAEFDDEHSTMSVLRGSIWVIRETSKFRSMWNLTIAVLLVYIATFFLYRLCFWTFHMPKPIEQSCSSIWTIVDYVTNALFILDLVLNFFFSYKDRFNKEVLDLKLTAMRYLRGFFLIDFLACIPDAFLVTLIGLFSQGTASNISLIQCGRSDGQAIRVARLQRVSRLTRLSRLGRLAKLLSFKCESPLFQYILNLRGVRVINFVGGLTWIVHLVSCGWYLCAALHDEGNYQFTWVGRWEVSKYKLLLDCSSSEQWLTAMYFVFTCFTTVGFGDMSAKTPGEMVYVIFVMITGTVVHSIVITEVIQVVTGVDRTQEFVNQRRNLVQAFAQHTSLDKESTKNMKDWVTLNGYGWSVTHYNREEMREIITGKWLPRWLTRQVSHNLFNGRLAWNRLVRMTGTENSSSKLPILIALSAHRCAFGTGELIYQMNDPPHGIFLVLSGTLAYIGKPSKSGGKDVIPVASLGSGPSKQSSGAADADNMIHVMSTLAYATNAAALQPRIASTAVKALLFPYQLFSYGNYLGDLELETQSPRFATVRCESSCDAILLAIGNQDWCNLVDEFPDFGTAWRSMAHRREMNRRRCIANLKLGLTYKQLAAVHIQKAFRTSREPVKVQRSHVVHGPGYQKQASTCVDQSPQDAHCLRASVGLLNQQICNLRKELRNSMTAQSGKVTKMRYRL